MHFTCNVFQVRKRKWENYSSGEELFGLQVTKYPELEATEKEVTMLDRLYSLYVTVLSTIKGYGDYFWADVVEKIDEMGETVGGPLQLTLQRSAKTTHPVAAMRLGRPVYRRLLQCSLSITPAGIALFIMAVKVQRHCSISTAHDIVACNWKWRSGAECILHMHDVAPAGAPVPGSVQAPAQGAA